MRDSGAKPIKDAPSVAGSFKAPPEWRERCDVSKLNLANKLDYLPLHMDLIKSLVEAKNIEFPIYFLVGFDLYEFIKPNDFSADLVKEMISIHKKWPSHTRIVLRRQDFSRYGKIMAAFRESCYEEAASGAAMPLRPAFNCYAELSNVSQYIVRGSLHPNIYSRAAAASTAPLARMPSTKDILQFVVSVIGKNPVIYDHAAVTSLLSLAIGWNSLRLPKREVKLCGQAGLTHDIERHCAYLLKPAVPKKISESSIKELEFFLEKEGSGFHESVIQTMRQYREKFGGGGFPEGRSGAQEKSSATGINRVARIVSIACAFSEYLLKRQDKHPLTLPAIMDLMRARVGTDFDPDIFDAFAADAASGKVYKMKSAAGRDEVPYED